MNFKRLLNHMAPRKRFGRMTERTFRSILAKYYPGIKFHGEESTDLHLYVKALGNWEVDRVTYNRDTCGVSLWRPHSYDYGFESAKAFREWVAKQVTAGHDFEREEQGKPEASDGLEA